MRFAVGLLASLSVVGLSQAFATDPPSPSAAPPASPSAAAPTSTPAAQPAAPAKDAKDAKAELTAQEKNLISQGYKMETHSGGEKYFCKSEASLGSRFPHKQCRSEEQIMADTRDSKDITRQVQQGYAPPPAGH